MVKRALIGIAVMCSILFFIKCAEKWSEPTSAAAGDAIAVSKTSISVTVQESATPATQTFKVWNTGTGSLEFSVADNVDWLSCTPTSGTSSGSGDSVAVTVTITTTGMTPTGTIPYTGTITVSAPGTIPKTVDVTLLITKGVIALSTDSIATVCVEGADATAQTFTVTNSGSGEMVYQVTPGATWITCTPSIDTISSATDAGTITITYATSALAAANVPYTANIAISSATAAAETLKVSVNVVKSATPLLQVSRSSITAGCVEGNNAESQLFQIWNGGAGSLAFTISDTTAWLACDIAVDTSTSITDITTVQVSFASSALAASLTPYTSFITVAADTQVQQIPVTLLVSQKPAPYIGLSRDNIYAGSQAGTDAAAQSFLVWNSGTSILSYAVAADTTWLTCAPAKDSSSGPSDIDTIAVSFATSSLPATGLPYTAKIIVSDSAAAIADTVDVTLTISSTPQAVLGVSVTNLYAECLEGSNATAQTFQVWNSGTGTLSFGVQDAVDWMSVSPTSGSSTGASAVTPVTITYATSTLDANGLPRTGTITVAAAGVDTQTITVTLMVTEPPQPAISVNPTSLKPSSYKSSNASSQTFQLWNSGTGTLNFSIADNASWLNCIPTSGVSTGLSDMRTIMVYYSNNAMNDSTSEYPAEIVITGTSATPETLDVGLTIVPAPAPIINTSVVNLYPSCQEGSNATAQTFQVWNSGTAALSFNIEDDMDWVTCIPTSGTSANTSDLVSVTVNYNTSSLDTATHTGTITVTGGTGVTSQNIGVSLAVSAAPPAAMFVDTDSLSTFGCDGHNALAQTFNVWNTGGDSISFSVTDSIFDGGNDWLSTYPTSGTSTGTSDKVTVTVYYSNSSAGYTSANTPLDGHIYVNDGQGNIDTIFVKVDLYAEPGVSGASCSW